VWPLQAPLAKKAARLMYCKTVRACHWSLLNVKVIKRASLLELQSSRESRALGQQTCQGAVSLASSGANCFSAASYRRLHARHRHAQQQCVSRAARHTGTRPGPKLRRAQVPPRCAPATAHVFVAAVAALCMSRLNSTCAPPRAGSKLPLSAQCTLVVPKEYDGAT